MSNADNNTNSSLPDKNHNNNKIKSKINKLIIIIIACFAVILITIGLYLNYSKYESTDDAFIEGNITQISPKISGTVIHIYVNDNQKIKKGQLLYEIDPKDYLAQVAKAKGQLDEAIAKYKGANTNIGLTDITATGGLKQATSNLEYNQAGVSIANQEILIAKNNISQTHAQVKQAEALISQNIAQVQSSKANVKLALQDLARIKSLYEEGAVSRQQYDVAVTNYHVANAGLQESKQKVISSQAALKSSQAALKSAQDTLNKTHFQEKQANAGVGQSIGKLQQANTISQNVFISKTQRQAFEGQIKQYKANLKQAQLNLSYTKVHAPISGKIARKTIEKGMYLQPGQATLAIVPEIVWVIANYKETQLTNMKPGQIAEIKVDAYPHKRFKGHVDSIQLGTGSRFSLFPPENAVGSFVKIVQRVPVKIIFDDKPYDKYVLAPGMSVEPKVRVK